MYMTTTVISWVMFVAGIEQGTVWDTHMLWGEKVSRAYQTLVARLVSSAGWWYDGFVPSTKRAT